VWEIKGVAVTGFSSRDEEERIGPSPGAPWVSESGGWQSHKILPHKYSIRQDKIERNLEVIGGAGVKGWTERLKV